MKKGIIVSCYGCGYAACSMCPVYNCSNEVSAITKLIKVFGIRRFLKYMFSKIRT